MPSPVYSVCLLAGTTSSTTPAFYTVPVGFVAIIRDLDVVSSGTATASNVILCSSGLTQFVWVGKVATTFENLSWRGRQVYVAGQTVGIASNQNGHYYRLSGYLLSA